MNRKTFAVILTVLVLFCSCAQQNKKIMGSIDRDQSPRERLLMDFDWKFAIGHLNDIEKDFNYGWGDPYSNAKTGDLTGPTRFDFEDDGWKNIDLPHDWAIELDFDEKADNSHGYKKIGRAYPENSIGWYRKTFTIPESEIGKRLRIEFDGVYRDSEIWLNGHPMGRHLSGYTGFGCDISDYVNYGDKNVLVVRVDASWNELWSYEGAGIYRHVWLVKTSPMHVLPLETFVISDIANNDGKSTADLTITTSVANEQEKSADCTVISSIVDNEGNVVAETHSMQTMLSWSDAGITHNIPISNPMLWSVDSPYLYRLVTTVKQGANTVDTSETTFGIREIRFDANEGFFLNGKPLKLNGVCCHQDHAGVGTALPDRLHEFRIEKLEELGGNAYRCAHNPPAPEILDACDRLGMLVIDEQRMTGSTPELMGQLESLIKRDRNHPSIILWMLGNEEHIIQGNDVGARIVTTMKRLVRKLDPTRLVTLSMNGEWGSVVTAAVDVQGCNYLRIGDIDEVHKNFPDKPMILSESGSTLSTRGIYTNAEKKGFYSAYDANFPEWGVTAEHMLTYCMERPFLAGTFVWTGFDYHGEPYPYGWPCVNSNFGIMDLCGFLKDNYYYYKSWWSSETVLHILPHWNWTGKEGADIDVWCQSNCDEVELFLNGKSLGKKAMKKYSHLEWKVAYEPGTLEARGYKNGTEAAVDKVETTGIPTQIKLTPDRMKINADNEDVSIVTVSVLDDRGLVVPTAGNDIIFSISGNAEIIGLGNGNPSSHEPEKGMKCKVFGGLCQVIIQSGREQGEIKLEAESHGLKPAAIVITAAASSQRLFVQ